MADENKALIASSEFDPANFIKGIDDMTAALGRLSAQEDAIRGDLSNINTALVLNRKELKATQDQITALNKSSNTYQEDLAKLTGQQTELNKQQGALQGSLKTSRDQLAQVNTAANNYKGALTGITAVAKQVAADNKGRTLFDVASMNQQVKDITDIGIKYRNIFKGKIDTKELDELEDKLLSTKDQFTQLKTVVDFTEAKLSQLDPNSEAFADLTMVVEKGKEILEEFGNVEESVGKRSQTLTGRLRQVRNDMAQLQATGETNTQQFQDLTQEAAHLQDAIEKTGQRVRAFASDTRLIEAGVQGLRAIAGGFALVEGASALFGIKNEAAQESIKRLTAIMAIANGLQEVSNILKKESVIRIVGEEIATKAYIITQRVLAATLGTTAAASRGLAIAIAATGIGALVVGIGLLVSALMAWAEEATEAEKAQHLLNLSTEEGIKFTNLFIGAIGDAGKQIQADTEKRQAINDKVSVNEKTNLVNRIKNAQELRKVDLKNTEDQLAEARRREDMERAGYERAATRRKDALEGRIKISNEELKELGITVENFNKIQTTGFDLENQLNVKRTNDQRDLAKERTEITKFELAQLENYTKRLTDLQKRLTDDLNKGQRQDAAQIAKQAADQLKAEQAAITAEVRKGGLTAGQGQALKKLLKEINGVELATELKEFRKKSLAAEQSIQDAITSLRIQVGTTRANLIRDELEAEAALIKVNFQKESQELETAQRDALRGVQDALDQGLISPDQAQKNADDIRAIYARMFGQLVELNARSQEALAAKTFERVQENVRTVFAGASMFVAEATADELIKLAARFTSGKISYERYQRELTELNRTHSYQRIAQDIRENEALLQGLQARIQLEKDPARLKALQDEEKRLRTAIAELKGQLAGAEVQGTKADDDKFKAKVAQVAQYATAINNVVQAVVGFWQQANEAEQAQLDRSIAIQEKRVDAATRIAERGNAEYLRLEQDRLDELHLKQENAARRQIAINAVLQTSQALTAFISALAQGIAQGGPLGGLAIAAAVLGAIAAGYAIVNSLQQQNTQSLAEGTKSVELQGSPDGVDTVPARLTKGEAVLPVDVNRDYHPAVAAIYDRKIPADEMNSFVNNYRVNRRQIPGLDHEHLGDMAGVVVTYDGQLLEATQAQTDKLERNAELLNKIDKRLANLGISVNVDRNGLAVSVLKAIEQHKIDKKA